jgi:aspartyl-tRNA(Asn)/glutamyl-tRNA(Gln) amidotransferase subunit C
MSASNPTVHIDVARVCELAHFDMAPDEMAEFQGQLEKILGYVEKIGELDLGGIEPTMYGQPVKNVFREDVNEPSLAPAAVMANAPASIGGEFKVPRIVE